jgi:hypothetical protein
LNLPTNQHDEVPPDELTPREAMREIGIILGDILTALVAIFVGATIHASLHGPQWLVPLSMVPFALWLWWRGKVPREVLPFLMIAFFVFTTYLFLRDLFWPNGPGWARWVDMAIYLAVTWVSHLFALAWKKWAYQK